MAKKIRWIFVIFIIIILFFAVIAFFHKLKTKEVTKQFNEIISKYDKNAKLDYDKIIVQGVFKPKSVTCIACEIKNSHSNLQIKELTINVEDLADITLFLNDVTYTKGDFNNKQSTFNYKLTLTERVKITYSKIKDNINYTVIIPQELSLMTPYNNYFIKYQEKETPFSFHLQNGVIQSLQYKDKGIDIYDEEQKHIISTADHNIINISNEKKAENNIFNIYIESNDNKIVNSPVKNNSLTNHFFSILLDAQYLNDRSEENLLKKNLIITNFDISLPDIKFHLDGSLTQDMYNFIPYGTLNFTMNNYKEFISDFYDMIKTEHFPDNAPRLFHNIKNDTERQKEKALSFLKELNNDNTNVLNIVLTRQSEGFPFVNNLSVEEITQIYNKIFTVVTDKSSDNSVSMPSQSFTPLPENNSLPAVE